ncbi:IucA/IucC family protein [Corynebacterium sp. MNWGS58]|uniref:IucA/IucC family protein n=1 Tax=Corynebacterium sp. 102791.4 TaxID=3104612 RepID=UPI003512CFA5
MTERKKDCTVDTQTFSYNAWVQAGKLLCQKILSELSYEQIISPEPVAQHPSQPEPPTKYKGMAPWQVLIGRYRYVFWAREGVLGTWVVDEASIICFDTDTEDKCLLKVEDPTELIINAQEILALEGVRLGELLRELIDTRHYEAMRLERKPSVEKALELDYNVMEKHLPGHPRIIINKGRVGFSFEDMLRYSPETQNSFPLRWIGVHKTIAEFGNMDGLSACNFYEKELGPVQHQKFRQKISARCAQSEERVASDYILVPVHPWQWQNIIAVWYVEQLVNGDIIDLGEGEDLYAPQQTIRTLYNRTSSAKADVKTACSVRNTLVYRGLDRTATKDAPLLNDWLRQIHESDDVLSTDFRFDLLYEVASVSVRHPKFSQLRSLPYWYQESLGALWRAPLTSFLEHGEKAVSLATLPYESRGGSVVAYMVRASGLTPVEWFSRLWRLILQPNLRWFYYHGVAFCPHSQNLILVVDEQYRPQRVLIKDFAQGADLVQPLDGKSFASHDKLPKTVRKNLLAWDASLMAQAFFSSIFSGQIRFLAEIAWDQLDLERTTMWDIIRKNFEEFFEQNPAATSIVGSECFYVENLERVCLNREQLSGEGFNRVDRDEEFDVRYGVVPNPLLGPDSEGHRW